MPRFSFAYAQNLAAGHGFVLTPAAAPVEGFSNPLWVGLLTGPAALGLDLELVAKLLGLGCAVAAGPFLYAGARRAGLGRWLAALGPWLLTACTGYALWAQAGLENGALALGLAAALAATLRELDDPAAAPWSALPLGLVIWLRPEAPLLVGLLLGMRATWVWHRRLPWRREALLCGLLLAQAALLLGLRWSLFGELVPNTYFAKLTGRSDYHARGRRYLLGFVLDYRLWLFAWAPIGAFLVPRARPAAALALALIAGAAGFAWHAGGDWAHGYRFLTPAFVGLALLVPLGIHGLGTRAPEAWRRRALAAAALAALAGERAARDLARRPDLADPQFAITVGERAGECHELGGLGRLLGLDRPLALEVDVGGMAYCDELEILDWVGLADWTIPRLHGEVPALREYVFGERAPDLGWGRGEVPPALADAPEQDSAYLALHRRGWHPRLSLWLRRDSVLSPFALPARLGREIAPGAILTGARVISTRGRPRPARARPGQPARACAACGLARAASRRRARRGAALAGAGGGAARRRRGQPARGRRRRHRARAGHPAAGRPLGQPARGRRPARDPPARRVRRSGRGLGSSSARR